MGHVRSLGPLATHTSFKWGFACGVLIPIPGIRIRCSESACEPLRKLEGEKNPTATKHLASCQHEIVQARQKPKSEAVEITPLL